MTAATRTRLERVRSSVGIAKLAVQQLEDELGGPVDFPRPTKPLAEAS